VEEEIWKDIKGYEGYYQISNRGIVRSLDRKIEYSDGRTRIYKGKIIKQLKNNNGYLYVRLSKGSVKYGAFLHKLIAIAFIPNPNNYPIVNHKDENPLNNSIKNLEWCTYKYNNAYNNLIQRRTDTFNRKLVAGEYPSLNIKCQKIVQLNYKYELIKVWNSSMDIERGTGIKSGNISLCLHKKRKSMGKDKDGNYYHWMYYDEYVKLSDKEKEELHNKYCVKEAS